MLKVWGVSVVDKKEEKRVKTSKQKKEAQLEQRNLYNRLLSPVVMLL